MTDQKPTISLAQWCAYLPYSIDVFLDVDAPIRGKYLLQPNNFSTVTYSGAWKPLLRPMNEANETHIDELLSDIVSGNHWYYYPQSSEFGSHESNKLVFVLDLPYVLIQKLLAAHYDIFNLIPQGLALPIE